MMSVTLTMVVHERSLNQSITETGIFMQIYIEFIKKKEINMKQFKNTRGEVRREWPDLSELILSLLNNSL